jgi:hypothetical protein
MLPSPTTGPFFSRAAIWAWPQDTGTSMSVRGVDGHKGRDASSFYSEAGRYGRLEGRTRVAWKKKMDYGRWASRRPSVCASGNRYT